ncbi:MAG: hypothetical protein CL696_01350 [Chloroflexi bacterium]|jgi:hypothetical protein|nr:hypothetical protein [Chloroflexota bacterium]MDP6497517.1 hypothetical protein [Dehalococcoidia bacterium]MQG10451.1 hypothetical protein [SAR202 cluster bacterium]MQG54698.1 hypothetical protein [SAR202 cluster bacterium]|tara:strand:- start:28461 stop:29135 length:675 start_codon:yes stop_codon:yes gene_type:complete
MVKKKGSGLLMVFADVDVEYDADYNAWYREEHLPERLSAPGFLDAALYQAVKGGPRYLAVYELESAAAMQTPEYLHMSQNPTDWTKRISPTAIGRGTVRNIYTQISPEESDPDTMGRGMAPALQIGRMEVPSDIEAKYNDYYDNQRTPRNLTVPGCLFVRRYHAVEGNPQYLTMYEFEHEKVPESLAWEDFRKQDTMHDYIGGNYSHQPGSPGVYRRISPGRAF